MGSLVSIGGAIWASCNVRIVKKTKEEIFSKLRIVKYSEISNSSKSTINQLRKIANKDKIPPGVNFKEIIDSLNIYYESLISIKNDIQEDGFIDLERYLDELRTNITIASKLERKAPKDLINIYTKIYYHILDIDCEIVKYNKKLLKNSHLQ